MCRPARWIAAALVAAISCYGPTGVLRESLGSDAAGLRVERILVPEEEVGSAFPPGSDLVVLPEDRFETLVRSAEAGLRTSSSRSGPRLVRARHEARWRDGVLLGRSTLSIGGAADRAGLVRLEPWTPAILESSEDGTDGAPRTDVSGVTAVRVGPGGPSQVVIEWELAARPGSSGRVFALGLPACEVSELTLDLPADVIPEGPPGIRRGPAATSPGGSLRRWSFHGASGDRPFDLRCRVAGEADAPRFWVGGDTRIVVDDAAAGWSAEWSVEVEGTGPHTLEVELDEPLQLVDVEGPGVRAFSESDPREGPARVAIRLGEAVEGSTELTLRAVAAVPDEGPWVVPAARPLGAVWVGGRTTVRVGPSRVVEACRELAGPAVPPSLDDLRGAGERDLVFVYSAVRPDPVAELTFRAPVLDAAVDVSGHVHFGRESSRLEARLAWSIRRGSALTLRVELPELWEVDEVTLADATRTALSWQVVARDEGGSDLLIHIPAALDITRPDALVILISADAQGAERGGPLRLPRVRPREARLSDERWVATTEPRSTLRPVHAGGLAWMPPGQVGVSVPEDVGTTVAWRWNLPDGEARVELEPVGSPATAEVVENAWIDEGRLTIDLALNLDVGDGPLEMLPVLLAGRTDLEPAWRLLGVEGSQAVSTSPLAPEERVAAGLPAEGGVAQIIRFPSPRRGPVDLRARVVSGWDGSGTIPLVVLPGPFQPRGRVSISVQDAMRSTARVDGLIRLEPSPADLAGAGNVPGAPSATPSARFRLAHVYGYGYGYGYGRAEEGPRLDVRTESLEPARSGGVIQDAVLSSPATTGERAAHELTLHVLSTGSRTLDFTMPPGSTLHRVQVDGRPLNPSRRGTSISLPIPGPSASRPLSTVHLEYDGEWIEAPTGRPGALRFRPPCPEFSMPCLNFTWEVNTPEAVRTVRATGGGLVPGEPERLVGWPQALLGRWPTPGGPRRVAGSADAGFESFNAWIPTGDGGGIALGRLLRLWDAGPRPIVVDRPALATGGWGPQSRLTAPEVRPGSGASWHAWFRGLGLQALPFEDALLITTAEQARLLAAADPGARGLRRALRRAVGSGGGPADRFQAVARWREQDTRDPRGDRAAPDEGFGRATRWFERPGWPRSGALAVTCWSSPRLRMWSWAAGLGVLGAGIAARGRSPRARLWGVLAIGTMAILGAASGSPTLSAVSMGVACGAIGSSAFWLGRSLHPRPEPVESAHRQRSRTGSRPTSRRVESLALLVAALPLLASEVAGQAQELEGTPLTVLAVIPHDGTGAPLGRVWLLREDADRLERLGDAARADAQAPPAPGPWALDVVHEVDLRDDSAAVESAIELELDGPGPVAWPVPLGDAQLEWVELDGARVPVAVVEGGATAECWISGAGHHRVRIRRVVRATERSERRSLELPVHPVPTARVRWGAEASGFAPTVPSARGVPAPEGGAEAEAEAEAENVTRLGPAAQLEVRWGMPDRSPPPVLEGTAEGIVLWDAEPSGDRIRARLHYQDVGEVSSIRVRLGPGIQVRGAEIAGMVDAGMEGTDEAPVWVARLDPPLSGTASLWLDLWRPSQPPDREGQRDGSSPLLRSFPRVEPLGVLAYTGTLGFRRPAYWRGRIGQDPMEGVEAVPDEQFVRSWGDLPQSSSTLAGAIRFASTPQAEILTGPSDPRATVRQTVDLVVQPGRLLLRARAELSSDLPAPREFEVGVPAGLRVIRIDAVGLTDWSRPEPGRLRLRFDGSARGTGRRMVWLEGWIGSESDPLSPRPGPCEMALPWPFWRGATARDGLLRVSSDGGGAFEVLPGPGLAAVVTGPDDSAAAEPTSGAPRLSYSVAGGGDLGTLRWVEVGPKIQVVARSLMTVHPEVAELSATLRYTISGGPLRRLVFRLPAAWAETATVEARGVDRPFQTTSTGGLTEFALDLDEPIWGAQEIQVRALRPFDRVSGLDFPDVVPLMPREQQQGFETYLLLADASGHALAPGGSSEVRPIDPARFGPIQPPPPASARLHAYAVLQDGWRVTIQPDRASGSPEGGAGSPPVSWADVHCVVSADGSGLGRATYDLGPQPGAFLSFVLPEGARPVASTVDLRPVRPLRSASGEWYIPLGARNARWVVVAWEVDRTGPSPDGRRPIPLPILEQPAPRTLLTIWSRAGDLDAGAFPPVAGSVLERERLRAMARRIVADIDPMRFDRSSSRDRADLLARLVDFQVQRRAAERSALLEAGTVADPSESPGLLPQQAEIQAIQDELDATLEAVGFADFLRSSRVRAGDERGDDPLAEIPELVPAPALLDLRRLGEPRAFLIPGESLQASAIPVSITDTTDGQSPRFLRPATLTVLGLLCLGMALTGVIDRLGRPAVLAGSIALLGGVGLVGLSASGSVLLLLALGWATVLPSPNP